uniref:Ubiquitin-like domain-containing protein n=1 Tax=Plectus sambesii TaxID=2011161 RepID=A0A914XR30_9BILA
MADDLVEAGLISVFNKSAKFSPTLIKRDHAIRTLGDEEYRAGTIGIDHIFKTVLKVNHGQEAIHEKNDSDDEDYAVHDSNNPKIFVKTSSRKIIAINISLSATVDELKSIVQEREGIPIPKQQLLLCGRLLGEGGRTLQDCNVQEGATLHVIDSTVDPMVEVFVKTLTGRTISLQIPLSTSVEDVRAFIQDREGIPEDHQRLLIGGQQMDDGRSLAEYNVMEWSTIHLVLRLRGGGFSCYHTEMKYFDEAFNYDFSKFPADTVRYYRGGQQYHRPIGSKRYALKV